MIQKNYLHITIALLCIASTCIATIASCNTDDINAETRPTPQESEVCIINSSLSQDEYATVSGQICDAINFSTRTLGNELSENEAKSILKPLANDGRLIQGQLLQQKDKLALTPVEIKEIRGMTDMQLADLSFFLNSMYNGAVFTQSIGSKEVVDCLLYATGFDSLSSLFKGGIEIGCISNYYNGTKLLMSAKNARQIIFAFAKRSVGWVGIAWMVYDFGSCIKSKQK